MSDQLNLATIAKRFSNGDAAREFLGFMRWPNGPVCPRCKSTVGYRLTPRVESTRLVRKGVLKCKVCRKQFRFNNRMIKDGERTVEAIKGFEG
ncbi:MAG: transposase [Pyrinomonadaceae bacterium]